MKRVLLIAALCLSAMPAQGAVYEWTGNNNLVVGDFANLGQSPDSPVGGHIYASYSWIDGPQFVNNVPHDFIFGPFSSYSASFYFNGAFSMFTACDQWEAHCGQTARIQTSFEVTEAFPTIVGYGDAYNVFGPNVQDAPYRIFITLPDGFSLVDPIAAAVPEPSTWAMLLLGFAGIVFMGRRRQRITAPSNCM